jgi:hypothetical protein
MDFKRKDNNLIWENYAVGGYDDDEEKSALDQLNGFGGDDYSDDEYEDHGEYDDDDDDGAEVVMSFDTGSEIEPEMDHEMEYGSDHNKNTELCDMVCSELKKLGEYAKRLEKIAKECDFEEWMLAKITKAADYASDVYYSASHKVDYANSPDVDDEYEF